MTALIDSTEMHLRTLYELREEGIPSLRARLVERLRLSAPAVTEAIGRLASLGMLEIAEDRTVHLTDVGLARAASVMRKHRLAELLLTEVIGLDWTLAHDEACRWEHVISDAVEQRLTVLLHDPQYCPHGNRIPPAASQVGSGVVLPVKPVSLLGAARDAGGDTSEVTLAWISESLQTDVVAMRELHAAALLPGIRLGVRTTADGVRVRRLPDRDATGDPAVDTHLAGDTHLAVRVAALLYVEAASA